MGLLANRLGIRAFSIEDPAQPLLPPSALMESLGMGRSDAGVLVNEKQSMRLTTVYGCVKIISEDLASTGHEILKELPDGSFSAAKKHLLWPIIHDQPNPTMTAKVFWGAMLACELLFGNGYAWIKRDVSRRVMALVPLAPGKTAPVKIAGEMQYATTQTDSGHVAYIEPRDILHFKDVTLDGIIGLSPINACKNAIGLGLAAEKFGAQFFGNGARATGIFTYPGTLDEEAQENIQKSLREKATGEQALRPMILEDGMKWQQLTIPPNEAQFITTRQFQIAEVARLYRVALHLLQELLRATNNNIEHQSLDHVRYCLRPRAVGIEQEVNTKLLGGSASPYTMEHNLKDMQRGDFASQTAGIQVLRNIGYYSNNDIARELRQNPTLAEDGGDLRIVQGAMIPLTALLDSGTGGNTDAASTAPDLTQPFDRIAPAYRNLFRDVKGRLEKKGKHDPVFARKLIEPIVNSMAQALLAVRFGTCALTVKEQQLIKHVSARLAEQPLSDRAAIEAHIALAKEMLGASNVDESTLQFRNDGWVTIDGHPVYIGHSASHLSEKQKRAIASRKPCGADKQRTADAQEAKLSRAIGLPRTKDNSAFDLRNDDVGVELKTMVDGTNDKVTMSKAALGRKLAEAQAEKLKTFTVVADVRGNAKKATYYISSKLGSLRLGGMTQVTLAQIKEMVKP